MKLSDEIGTKIRKIRELRSLNQDYLAKKLGISINGYGKIERGETDVTLKRLDEIASILEIDTVRLITFDEKQIFNVNNSNFAYGNVENQNNNNNIELVEKVVNTLTATIEYQKQEIERLLRAFKN